MIFKKKEIIIRPDYLSIFYFNKSKFIIFRCDTAVQFLKLHLNLDFILLKNKFFISINFLNRNLSTKNKKKLKIQQKLNCYRIKLCIVEVSKKLYKKLNLVGVGYKIFKTKNYKSSDILLLKLGFSHFIFIKIKKLSINLFCLKNIKFFINGNFVRINQICALIKSFKKPELYKGKGIRFQNEKIILKQIRKK